MLQWLQQCNPSALAYSVVQFICCNRPAVKPRLSYGLQAPLQPVCSAMVSQLGSSLLTQSVSSAAIRQLSCNVSTQLSCCLKAQLQIVSSAVRSFKKIQDLQIVSWAAKCQLIARMSAPPWVFSSASMLSCNPLAQSQRVSSASHCHGSAGLCTRFGHSLTISNCRVRL